MSAESGTTAVDISQYAYPRAIAPAMATPRAADFPLPRAAVSATVLRNVFSEIASRKVITAFAYAIQIAHIHISRNFMRTTKSLSQNITTLHWSQKYHPKDTHYVYLVNVLDKIGNERELREMVPGQVFGTCWPRAQLVAYLAMSLWAPSDLSQILLNLPHPEHTPNKIASKTYLVKWSTYCNLRHNSWRFPNGKPIAKWVLMFTKKRILLRVMLTQRLNRQQKD